MRKSRSLPKVLVPLLLAVIASSVMAADLVTVDTPDGKRQVMCEVLEETYRYVRVESEGEEQELYTAPKYADDPDDVDVVVLDIERENFPSAYGRANMDRKNRKFAAAYKKYADAGEELSGDTAWVAPYIWYYAANSAFNEAKYARMDEEEKAEWYERAAGRYERLLEREEEHYFAPDAKLGLAKARVQLEQYGKARDVLDEIADSDYPEETKRHARVWEGNLMIAEERVDEAIETLQALQEELMDDYPQLAYQAMMFEAFAWQTKENFPRAESLFRDAGLRSPDDEMRAEAFNNRGLSLKARGQVREALFSFLRVVVLHSDIRHEYQRALFNAAVTSKEYYS
ncbi:MAG: tetratricopeptide repeat protein, partial [Planctomycetota bacterium]